jgi:hypothetical protein
VTQEDPRPGVEVLSLITVTVISDDAWACIAGSGEGRHRDSGDLRRKPDRLAGGGRGTRTLVLNPIKYQCLRSERPISFVAVFCSRIADGDPRCKVTSRRRSRREKNWQVGTRIRFLGWYRPGIGHPPSFPIHPSMTATVINHDRNRDRGASTAATGRGNDPSIPGSLCGRARGCFGGPVGGPGTCERGGQQSTR